MSCSCAAVALPNVRGLHFFDIARSQIDFRFRWKSGRAAHITAMTEYDPTRNTFRRFRIAIYSAQFTVADGSLPRGAARLLHTRKSAMTLMAAARTSAQRAAFD